MNNNIVTIVEIALKRSAIYFDFENQKPLNSRTETKSPLNFDMKKFVGLHELRSPIANEIMNHQMFHLSQDAIIAGIGLNGTNIATTIASVLEIDSFGISERNPSTPDWIEGKQVILISPILVTAKLTAQVIDSIRQGAICNSGFSLFDAGYKLAKERLLGESNYERRCKLSSPCNFYSLLSPEILCEAIIEVGTDLQKVQAKRYAKMMGVKIKEKEVAHAVELLN